MRLFRWTWEVAGPFPYILAGGIAGLLILIEFMTDIPPVWPCDGGEVMVSTTSGAEECYPIDKLPAELPKLLAS